MPKSQPASTELLADYFVSYLFAKYHGARHVRRIASWIGFIIKAIEKLPCVRLERSRSRQIRFEYKNHSFKVRYAHGAGQRGGVEIVEVFSGRGAPEGQLVASVTNLSEAAEIYDSLRRRLDSFVESTPAP